TGETPVLKCESPPCRIRAAKEDKKEEGTGVSPVKRWKHPSKCRFVAGEDPPNAGGSQFANSELAFKKSLTLELVKRGYQVGVHGFRPLPKPTFHLQFTGQDQQNTGVVPDELFFTQFSVKNRLFSDDSR
ncbi:hypothetical protein HAX54_003170, partial [Datura stramonium]|nr:hypothetical protein [Datura stramonium]